MQQTFTHTFEDGREASQTFELNVETRTYHPVPPVHPAFLWAFAGPFVYGTENPELEFRTWAAHVNIHFCEIGFRPVKS